MVCFVGIDLGTAKSGYSYSFSTEPTAIKIPQQFTPDDEVGTPKTDTALLFQVLPSGEWQLKEWGTSAVNKYKVLDNSTIDSSYALITGKQFKLALAESRDPLPEDYMLPAGCPFSAPQLITYMLYCLKRHAAQHLQQTVGVDMDKTEVHYCLSVPAGWSLKAKRIMHAAAEQAGMTAAPRATSSSDTGRGRDQEAAAAAAGASSSVVLIHEQEAAALTACRDPCKDVPTIKAAPGQIWLILDAGGGTVDIAMHRIEKGDVPGQAKLSEVLRAVCLLKGSSRLDQQAEEQLLRPLFGAKPWEYDRWKRDDPQGFISQMREWELVKMKFGAEGLDTPAHLKLEFSLIQRLPQEVAPQRGRLTIEPEAMAQLVFDPVVKDILGALHMMLSTPRASDGGVGADVLIMAGGFGANGYLRRRVMDVCGRLLKQPPVTPANSARAVVFGNTIHLQQPDAIAARVSRLTYGVVCGRRPTQSCIQNGHTVHDRKGAEWCDTHFFPMVKVNEVVRLHGASAPFVVYPMSGASKVRVPIYATESADAEHITEKGMQQIGTIEVLVMKQRKGGFCVCGRMSSMEYKIELTIEAGAAELRVRAFDVTNNCYVQCSVEFSSEAASSTCVTLPST